MRDYKVIVIAFLVGIAIFSGYNYFTALKEKYDLRTSLEQLNSQISVLEDEKQGLVKEIAKERDLQRELSQENSQLSGELKFNKDKIVQLDAQFQVAVRTAEELNSQIYAVRAENTALRDQIENLNLGMTQAVQDKDRLEARLGSITELKKAIKELKRKVRRAKKELVIRTEEESVILGNLGYLIKDGNPTYPAKVKIEVQPLPSEN